MNLIHCSNAEQCICSTCTKLSCFRLFDYCELAFLYLFVLFLDGRSNRGNLNKAARDIQNAGIQVYAVGIGNIARNQLNRVASDPNNTHVFILRSYRDAAGFVDFLSVVTCDGQ